MDIKPIHSYGSDIWHSARQGMQNVGPSFGHAWRQMTEAKKPGLFFAKTGATALGGIMTIDGIYHNIAGLNEKTEDLFLAEPVINRNWPRVMAGTAEAAFGLAIGYLGATKPGRF